MSHAIIREDRDARPADRAGERGAVLVMALLIALIVTLLGLSLATFGNRSVGSAREERQQDDALVVADAGLTHAKAILSALVMDYFTPILGVGDGNGCTGDELSAAPAGMLFFPPAAELIPPGGRQIGTGRYRVFVCDDHVDELAGLPPDVSPNIDANRRVKVRSVGTGVSGATVTLEIRVDLIDMPALIVDGDLRIGGSQTYMGAGGSVYARGNLDLSGGPCAEQYFAAGGSIFNGTNAHGGGTCAGPPDLRPDWEPLQLPTLSPASFATQATFLLGSDGRVRNQAGVILGINNWNGWNWTPGQMTWRAGTTIPPGVYYSQGSNINVIGSPPSGIGFMPLTLISDGWIDINGSPRMVPALPGPPAISMIAGTDIRISGSAGNPFTGLHYALHQVEFSGTPSMTGQVIVKNIGDGPYPASGVGSNLIALGADGYVQFNGNVNLSYAGGNLRFPAYSRWRECRQNTANPCGPA